MLVQDKHSNPDLKQFLFITSYDLRGPLLYLKGILNIIDRRLIQTL
jgi:hypothetical protein